MIVRNKSLNLENKTNSSKIKIMVWNKILKKCRVTIKSRGMPMKWKKTREDKKTEILKTFNYSWNK